MLTQDMVVRIVSLFVTLLLGPNLRQGTLDTLAVSRVDTLAVSRVDGDSYRAYQGSIGPITVDRESQSLIG